MSAPLVLLFFMLIGMRTLFAMPVELGANWIFRLREPADRRAVVGGVGAGDARGLRRAGRAVAAGLTGWLWGARVGILHGVFCGLMGLALVEVLLVRFCKVPFTCTYFPGTARVRVLWPAYLAAFTTYAYTSAALETDILLTHPLAYAVFCGIARGHHRGARLRSLPCARTPDRAAVRGARSRRALCRIPLERGARRQLAAGALDTTIKLILLSAPHGTDASSTPTPSGTCR